jgi:hypothetical protein
VERVQHWEEAAAAVCYTCELPTATERAPRPKAFLLQVAARDMPAHQVHMQAHMEEGGTMAQTVAQGAISDVLIVYAQRPLRYMLRLMLADEGYAVSDTPTYTAVLRYLHKATEPAVIVAGNSAADFDAEAEFFGHIMAHAALARQNRYVLLCTVPERLPADLQARLSSLGVPILCMPLQLTDVVKVVARLAGRMPAEGESEAEGRSAG